MTEEEENLSFEEKMREQMESFLGLERLCLKRLKKPFGG
jgi:hypothetical protein